ncbi:hypothetical protein EDB89DRAFT_657550 [Lactarius sanguifluus]|nr:hypothetical protein EDB89DRAFT_657550 [Lactarius sanguifluus]
MSARSKSFLLTFLLFPGWYTTDHRIVLHTSSLASTTIRGGLQVVRHTLQTIILQAVIGKNAGVKLISRIVLNATVPKISLQLVSTTRSRYYTCFLPIPRQARG